GWYQFHKKGLIDYRVGFAVGVAALCGSFIGANLALQVKGSTLRILIALITIAILPLLIFSPRKGIEKTKQTLCRADYLIGGVICFFIGIYGGFYGAMAGTFLCYVLIVWFGQTFLESAATFKIGSLFLTSMAAAIYASNGAIHYPMALAMFSGSCVGSYIGVHYANRIGNVWIKRLFILLVLIMIVKLLMQR
ncbi:MAG: sulfite exporter TauE/SafE family protein, partial [Deltaproteobacteria bacterium]